MSRRQLLAAAVLAGPAVLKAPRPDSTRPHTTIDEITKELRGSGLEGWPLVDAAIVAVNAAFDHHSLWHLWESPRLAVANGRGWSGQYNQALARVLRDLGFDVEVVHAARVRGLGRNPWWQAGHTWARVIHDGRRLEVCASRPTNLAGRVPFVAMSEVRPVHPWTRASVSAALAPVVALQAWRQVLGASQPRWVYRRFDEEL